MSEWVVWVPVTLLALGFLASTAALLRDRARSRDQLAAAYAVVAVLEERVSALEEAASVASVPSGRPPESPGDQPAYVITRIADLAADPAADQDATSVDRRIDGSLFADLVLRESLVKGISLAYGIGRALSPETRNRIRFLMRQEVKRSRKQRRADLRAARRHLADLQRAREDAA